MTIQQKDNKLWRITLDTNPEDCNFKCIMCEEHSEFSNFKAKLLEKTGIKRRIMPKEWLSQIFQEAKTLGISEIIPSTMGEPLLYEHFEMFISLARKNNIKLNLTTNGSFPKKTMPEWCKLLIPNCSDIKISLNGATKETSEQIMKGSNFEKQISNIKELVTFRNKFYAETNQYCSITLQLTFMQNNMHQIEKIIQLASELNIDRVKGHHLWTHFKEIEQFSFENSYETKKQWNEYVKKAYKTVEILKRTNKKHLKLENFQSFDLNSPKKNQYSVPAETNCPFLGKELWISATGKISPCCAPDELRNSLGNFGFYPKTKLSEVLNSENYKDLMENYKSKSVCKLCKMRR